MRILIVEDDPMLADGLVVGLGLAGFTPDLVSTCEDAGLALDVQPYEAIVLDLMLPDGSGLDILRRLRRKSDMTPVVMLTARDRVEDRIGGLDAGADDYVGKPFDLDELAARIRAVARRRNGRAETRLIHCDLELNPTAFTAVKAGQSVALTRREFAVLRTLMERPGTILNKGQLEDNLYGWQEEIGSNAVEVHIHHLRAKLGPNVIETVRGLGYRLNETCI